MKLAVCFALALVGCGSSALPAPAADLAELVPADAAQAAADDFATAPAPADDLAMMMSMPPDMATSPPDLMCSVPLGGNCSSYAECCNGMTCGFPYNQVQPQHICCYDLGHPCVAQSDCCYAFTLNTFTYCNGTTNKCSTMAY